ncbi:unnamed protein product [Sphagnum balticum]
MPKGMRPGRVTEYGIPVLAMKRVAEYTVINATVWCTPTLCTHRHMGITRWPVITYEYVCLMGLAHIGGHKEGIMTLIEAVENTTAHVRRTRARIATRAAVIPIDPKVAYK